MPSQDPSPPPPGAAPSFAWQWRRWLAIPTLAAVAVVVLFTLLAITRFDINPGEIWDIIRASRPGYYLLALFAYYLTFPLRGLRWRMLLDNAGAFDRKRRPTVFEHSVLVLISWFANLVTWFRLGDAYRAFLLTSKWKLNFPLTMGTVLAERVMDIIVVLPLLLLAGIGLLRGETSQKASLVLGGATVLAFFAAAVVLVMRIYGMRVARFLPARLEKAFVSLQQGMMQSFRQMPATVLLTAAIWLLEAVRLYFVVHALGLELGLAFILFVTLANSMLTAIPVTPGGVGFVELGLTGLLVLALPRTDAAAVTLLDRSISYFSILVLGGAAFFLRQAWEAHRRARTRPPA